MKPSALENCRRGLIALPLVLWAASPAFASHSFDGNITLIFQNGGPNYKLGNGEFGDPPTAACMSLISTLESSSHNDNLASVPAGFWGGADPRWPNQTWQPSATSIANGTVDAVAAITYADSDTCDQCSYSRKFTQVCYRGAIDPAGADWTAGGWLCAGDSSQCLPPLNPPVIHTGVLTTQTWTAANTHILRGKVTVPSGVTLTIDPGVVVLGEKATGPSFLNVAVGGFINAQGTALSPIIFTSDQTVGVPGDWGGIVMSGDATANCADCRGDNGPPQFCSSEGDTTITFCGTDDCDSSGVVTYCRVQYSGFVLGANNELNSWTWNAQGSRTVAHHLQAHRGLDDSFEWFGGTMNTSHLVATGQDDDGLDWQAGFRGTCQFAVVQMAPDQGDRGIEADNWEFDFDAPCRSNPLMANLTLIAPQPGSTSDSGIVLRRGTDAHIFNSIVYDFPDANYEIRDGETCNRGAAAQAGSSCGPTNAPLIAHGGHADAVRVRTFPNPVVTQAQFALSLAHEGAARLDVYDVTGRHIANVLDRNGVTPGEYSVSWTPGADVSPGAYFYRLQNGGEPVTGKFVVVR